MANWKNIITRETTLLERYIKMAGYAKPLSGTTLAARSILSVSRDRVASQYFDEKELDRNTKILYHDFEKKTYKKIFKAAPSVLRKTITLTQRLIKHDADLRLKDFTRIFKQYIDYYSSSRAITLYSHLPVPKLENELKQLFSHDDFLAVIYPAVRIKGLERFLPLSRNHLRRKEFLVKRFAKNERINELIEYFEWRAYLHEVSEKITVAYSFPKIEKFLNSFAHRNDIPSGHIVWYLPDEIIKAVNFGKPLPRQSVLTRKNFYVLLIKKGKFHLFVEKDGAKVEQRELGLSGDQRKKLSSFVKGVTAQKGKVKGTVVILRKMQEMKEVKKETVIVTPMTRPQWLPAIKRAKAIVTDEGGITSHAAIVSRELKKPCIIGTKIATKVFKDGDLVEVDAERGVVKLLKKAR